MDMLTTKQHITHTLEQSGHRITEPREQVTKAIVAYGRRPFTGDDLYDTLRNDGLGRATVFRTLKLFQDLGIVSRLHLPEGCQHYVLTPPAVQHDTDHHDRLICRRCGRVQFLHNCPIAEAIAQVAKQADFQVDTHHLDLLGVCADCQNQ